MKRACVVAAFLCLLFVAAPARAYRPFDGTDADVAETGKVELELGPVGYYALAGRHYLIAPATVLNYGLIDRVELVLQGFNYIAVDSGAPRPRVRLLDTGLFVKAVLRKGCLQGGRGISIATEVGPLLPEINDQRSLGASFGGIATQCFGEGLIVHYNAVAELTRTPNLDLFGGMIFEGARRLRVRPVAEVYVERELNVSTTYSGLVGAIWRATGSLDLDVGLRTARVNGEGLEEVRLGLTWTFL